MTLKVKNNAENIKLTEEEKKERRRIYRKEYWTKNKEILRERYKEKRKQWREEHKEEVKAYREAYKEKRKARYYQKKKEYYENHKEEIEQRKKEKAEHSAKMLRAHNLVTRYRQSDKYHNRGNCTLTGKWVYENIFSKPCYYCGETDWLKLGCDRIDNTKPHTPDNVVPCCHSCNCHKHLTPTDKYIKIIQNKGS